MPLTNYKVVLVYKNQNASAKRFNVCKYYLPKGIIKNYMIIKLLWPSNRLWYKTIQRN